MMVGICSHFGDYNDRVGSAPHRRHVASVAPQEQFGELDCPNYPVESTLDGERQHLSR